MPSSRRPRNTPGCRERRQAALAVLEEHDRPEGLTSAAIRDLLTNRESATPWEMSQALRSLAASGHVEAFGVGDRLRYRLAGRHHAPPPPPEAKSRSPLYTRDDVLVMHETSAMSRQLANLFSICPYRYSDGEVVCFERGRVPMRPSAIVPTRVAGAW